MIQIKVCNVLDELTLVTLLLVPELLRTKTLPELELEEQSMLQGNESGNTDKLKEVIIVRTPFYDRQ